MLQDFRDNLRGVTATVLVAIIIVPFAFWGVESLFVSGAGTDEAAKVNGGKISELDVQRGIEVQRQKILSQFADLDPALLDDAQLREPVIKQLIRETLLTQTARSQGIAVSDQTFNEMIAGNEAFVVDGRFSKEQYEYQLSRLGYTPLSYREAVKNELLASQLTAGLQTSGIATAEQAALFGRLVLQQRSWHYLRLPLAGFKENISIDEASIAAYYDEHGEEFQEPDKVVVEYLELTPSDVEQFIEVDEGALRDRFEAEQLAAIDAGNSWQLAHILIDDKDMSARLGLIKEIEDKIAGGEDFAQLAKTYSADFGSAENGGDLGTFTKDSLPPGFFEAIDNLDVGQVSGPVNSESGAHLIKVLGKTASRELNFAEEKARLTAELRKEMAAEQLAVYVEKLKEETYNIESLAAAGESLGLSVEESQPFAEVGGDDIARYPDVVKASFSEDVLKHGYASDVLDLGEQHYVVVKLKEFIPAHQLALDTVRDRVVETLKDEEARKLAKRQAEAIVTKLAEGAEFDDIATTEGVQLETVVDATRFDQRASQEMVTKVFSYPSASQLPVNGLLELPTEIQVFSLTGITRNSGDKLSEQERQAMQQSLNQLLAVREFGAYLGALEASADIERRQ